jgi:CHRD domain
MNSRKRNLFMAGVGTAAALAIATPLMTPSSVATTPALDVTQLTAELSGANEVPPADPNGVGEANVFRSASKPRVLCWVLMVDRVGVPTDAHIHRGAEGVVGPVRVPFTAPRDGESAGCVRTPLAARIVNNPQNWYVNVHNRRFPSGAIRGQLG